MSWIEKCYETYENCKDEVGVIKYRGSNNQYMCMPLLPISHTLIRANIEVELDKDGRFLDARPLAVNEQLTIIPCTEDSPTRSGKALYPHALADKLQYVAKDYDKFGGPRNPGWDVYHEQLKDWCNSPYADSKACAVLRYLENESLILDLLDKNILALDENGMLPERWMGSKEDKPKVLDTMVTKDQTESFVRFRVDGIELGRDTEIQEKYIQYLESKIEKTGICTVQGKEMPITNCYPYNILKLGSHAKLISCNDTSNFTFRGILDTEEQAISIGYDTIQKAHNALRWLIGKQGCVVGERRFVVWGTKDESVPDIMADSMDLFDEFFGNLKLPPSTEDVYAKRFNDAIQGYGKALDEKSNIIIMALEAVTSGRLSICYYRETDGSSLIKNISDWHNTFSWRLSYRIVKETDKDSWKRVTFIGAPAPIDIAKAAYGEKASDVILQQTAERLISCITEKKPLPRDVMLNVVRRATEGIALKDNERRKVNDIACAVVHGYYSRNKGKEISMAVDNKLDDRNYLFGRVLACAEQTERWAQADKNSKKRPTNAERLRTAFVQHPAKTTALLQMKLAPYLDNLRSKGIAHVKYYELMLELLDRINLNGFNNSPLNELYLLGYASQMQEFWAAKDNAPDDADANDVTDTDTETENENT